MSSSRAPLRMLAHRLSANRQGAKPSFPGAHPAYERRLPGRAGFRFLQTCEKIVLFLSICMQEILPHALAALSDALQGGV